MKRKKNVLFTFDYEPFLGDRSGTVRNCIIRPTTSLLEILRDNNVTKSIFFIDTAFILRLSQEKDQRCQNDLNEIYNQLKTILKLGHYIFPHIHPHWIDATYDKTTGQWCLRDISKYRFSNISQKEKDVLFEHAAEVISQIQIAAGCLFKIDGYRAGGWCIQPFADFKQYFDKYGITNDFSVLSGSCHLHQKIYFDFRNFPRNTIYRFNEIEKPDCDGKYKEFTISNINVSRLEILLNKFLLKFLSKTGDRSFGDGLAVDKSQLVSANPTDKASNRVEMISVELLTLTKYRSYNKFLEGHDYMHFMSHPKMFSPHNLFWFNKFLKLNKKKYTIVSDYQSMKL